MTILVMTAYLFAYLIGALPTGFLVARWFGIADIRMHGSGNIGATNVARLLGPLFFIPIFLFDAGKAYLYLFVLHFLPLSFESLLLAAFFLLLGNSYSLFLYGGGGKGFATLIGILAAMHPQALLPLFFVWFFVAIKTYTVGIASVCATLSWPLYAYFFDYRFFPLALVASALVTIRHHANIRAFFF